MSDDPRRFESDGVSVHITQAPPVYDPGGPVAFIGDLPLEASGDLLSKAEVKASERGVVLMVVQCPVAARSTEELLREGGYTFASSWYNGSLTVSDSNTNASVRTATAADVPRILEIGERKREQYETFSPIFWKKAPAPRETFAGFITSQLESETNVALVFEADGEIQGYIIAQCRNLADGYVDDYAITNPDADWPTVGVALLTEASRQAQARGVTAFTIVTGYADTPKRAAVEACCFSLVKNWLVKPLP
jgi:predicted N-acetyltransferase YhbS